HYPSIVGDLVNGRRHDVDVGLHRARRARLRRRPAHAAAREPAQRSAPAHRMPAQLGARLERMLAKDASERPASMREIIDELDVALNDTLTFDFETAEPPREAPLANPTGPPDRPPPGLLSVSPNPPSGALAPGVVDGQALWEELRQSAIPQRSRLEPMSGHAPRVLVALAGPP